jgi:GNAT superfamily N-acetyltransferase
VRIVNQMDHHVGPAARSRQDGSLCDMPGADRSKAVDALLEAFLDDPLYRWLFDDPTTRGQALRDNFVAVTGAGATNGRLDTTRNGDAAAIWTEPGRALFDEPSELLDVLSRWSPPIRLTAASRAITECGRNQPADAAVLHLIGVRPRSAGSGIGSTLIRRRLVEFDRVGRAVYLESSNPRNHTFYARHGFRPVADVQLGDGGPSITCMLRPSSRPRPRARRTISSRAQ